MLSGMRRRAVRALDRVERWLEPESAGAAANSQATTPTWSAPTRAEVSQRAVSTPLPTPAATPSPATAQTAPARATPIQAKPVQATPVEPEAASAQPEPSKAPETEPPAAADAPSAGAPIELATLEQVLDDLVRPALQSDGGDITVVKIDNNDIHVRLIGACSTCPSSIMTLRMGVERLLREEFPAMGELIQVDDGI